MTRAAARRMPLLAALLLAASTTACGFSVERASVDLAGMDYERAYIHTAAGAIGVLAGEEAWIDATKKYLGDEPPELRVEVVDGTLEIEEECGLGYGLCVIDLDVVLPADVPVEVDTASGAVEIQGRVAELVARSSSGSIDVMHGTGAVSVESTSGAIWLENVVGDLAVHATSGVVEGVLLESDVVDVQTSSGLTALELAAPPLEVTVDSVSGGVDLTVPAEVYDLDLVSDTGGITVIGLDDEDGAERRISVHTSSGGISVSGG